MSTPTISVIVPTQGKPTLERMLDSVRDQLLPGDEVVVVVDSHEMSAPEFAAIEERVAPYGPQVRVTDCDAGCHSHGHAQINDGMDCARGDYLSFQDDDDVYTPFALAQMREAATAHPARPLLFRFLSFWGALYWVEPGLVRQAAIGGHCAVFPRDPAHLGKWGDRYEGDYDFLKSSLDSWAAAGVDPVWCLPIIAHQRPQEAR